jgi:hypothetical protein
MNTNNTIKGFQGKLIDLKNDKNLLLEFNKIGKDVISNYPNTKTANCFIDKIHYNSDDSIRFISISITLIWKSYRRKNYSLEANYYFENGNIKNSSIEKIY